MSFPTILLFAAGLLFLTEAAGQQYKKKFYIGIYGYDCDTCPPDGVGSADNIGLDDEYLKSLAQYNFNLLISPEPARVEVTSMVIPSLDFLNRVQKHGMQMIIGTPNMAVNKLTPVYNASKVAFGLNHYNSHPAVLGYDVIDEPCASAADEAGQVADQIVAYDAEKLPFFNLWPIYKPIEFLDDCNPATDYAGDYSTYVETFINTGKARMLAFDYYPLVTDPPQCNYTRSYFENLDFVAKMAADNDLPFFMVINSYQLLSDPITCAEQPSTYPNFHGIDDIRIWRYNIYSSLMYGAHGLLYWPREISYNYWNPNPTLGYRFVWDGGPGEGVSGAVKSSLGDIHANLLDHDFILGRLKYRSSYHVTELPRAAVYSQYWLGQTYNDMSLALHTPHMTWDNFDNDATTIAIFNTTTPVSPAPSQNQDYRTNPNATDFLAFSYLTDEAGKNYLWVMNKDYRELLGGPAQFTLNFNGPKTVVDILDDRLCVSISSMDVSLLPGEGKLFLIDNSQPVLNITTDFPNLNATFDAGVINIRNGVDITGTSVVKCFAQEINVESAVNMTVGTDVLLRAHSNYCGTFHLPEPEPGDVVKPALKLTPNPNNGSFTVKLGGDPESRLTIIVENMLGQVVLRSTAPGNSLTEIKLSGEPGGMYVVKVMQDDQLIGMEKTVIAR